MKYNEWIGVDLDGTLAFHDKWQGVSHIGEPIPQMLARVKQWISEGKDVRIFTARMSPMSMRINEASYRETLAPIIRWCKEHVGCELPVTYEKDLAMVELWDDRAVQVIPNTGARADGKP